MKRIWRLCKERYAAQAFNGLGAKLYGGRWNEPGSSVVYTADSLALAVLETFAHLDSDLAPDDYVAIAAEVPARISVKRLRPEALPHDWRNYPAPETLRRFGEDWLRAGKTVVLIVPSVIVPLEENWLLNPAHPDFSRIVIHPPTDFSFDSRLWK